MCGELIAGQPWVGLNRVLIGSGKSYVMSEFVDADEGDYRWNQADEDDEDDEDFASYVALCFPSCLQFYIEGRMLEADIVTGN